MSRGQNNMLRQDIKVYNKGKVQLRKTNVTRYSCPAIIVLYIPDLGLKQLETFYSTCLYADTYSDIIGVCIQEVLLLP